MKAIDPESLKMKMESSSPSRKRKWRLPAGSPSSFPGKCISQINLVRITLPVELVGSPEAMAILLMWTSLFPLKEAMGIIKFNTHRNSITCKSHRRKVSQNYKLFESRSAALELGDRIPRKGVEELGFR